MCWGKVRDELTNTVGVFVLPTAQDTDIFTAALQCTIHIYREDGATAAAAALVSNFSQAAQDSYRTYLLASVISFWWKQSW